MFLIFNKLLSIRAFGRSVIATNSQSQGHNFDPKFKSVLCSYRPILSSTWVNKAEFIITTHDYYRLQLKVTIATNSQGQGHNLDSKCRLAPVLKTIFYHCVISYTCSQSNSNGSI